TQGYAGGEEESRGDLCLMARWIDSYHFARKGHGVTGRCAGLQHVHSIFSIENHAENGGESLSENADMTTWCDLVDLGGARNNRKSIKVSYIEVAAIGDRRRHDVALASGNVIDTGYLTLRGDLIQFAVIWFDGV